MTHGHKPECGASPTYESWRGMKRRCRDVTRDNAQHYALKGVTYDTQWECFENFLADMGERPPGLTLDRIDGDGGYTKGNCRWATPTEQTRNRGIAQTIVLDGEEKPLVVWARERGINYRTAYSRLFLYGWAPEAALSREICRGKRGPRREEASL